MGVVTDLPAVKIVIESRNGLRWSDFQELGSYRFLIFLFIRKDFVAKYKQNLLGPLWFLLQPLFMTVVFTLVFSKIGGIPTDGAPGPLFYMAGLTIWNYFAQTFTANSSLFLTNAPLYSKVYFPRLSIPIANVFSNLMTFGIQFVLFGICWAYYAWASPIPLGLHMGWTVLLLPLYLGILGCLALGIGLLFSSLTAKYRDLSQMSAFFVQLGVYVSAVIFSLDSLPDAHRAWLRFNPVAAVVECFRYSFLGLGQPDWFALAFAALVSVLVMLSGVLLFESTQKKFVDSI
jgi:lipopolysaccharide transport system permease protein